MKVDVSGITDVGLGRVNNEDAFAYCPNLTLLNWDKPTRGYVKNGNLGTIAIVADGMGGENAGEIASSIVLEVVKREFTPNILAPIVRTNKSIKEFLSKVVVDANNEIIKHVDNNLETMGMGTTIVILWIINNTAYIAWCGDSRCYLFNPLKGLKCLTKDHSYVQELIDKGKITIKQSFNHPDSSIITRCLGDCDALHKIDIVEYELKKHDQFILCSDGLCGYCEDKKIERILYENMQDVETRCEALVKLSLEAKGDDNISIVNVSTIEDDEIALPITFRMKVKSFVNRLF